MLSDNLRETREWMVYHDFLTAEVDFSAIETALITSSIVEMKVSSFVLHSILVKTFAPNRVVFTVKPSGASILSGEIASTTASASRIVL